MSNLMGEILDSSSSLSNQTATLSVISNNIANVDNSSYARESVETSYTSGPGGVVYSESTITSARDAILDRQVIEETSTASSLDETESLYDDLNTVMSESLNGSLGASLDTAVADGTGVTGAISSFLNAWSAYAASPNDSAAQSEVYTTAEDLIDQLNSASSSLDEVQDDENAACEDDVDSANELLQKIADLNTQILAAENRNDSSATELEDEREAAMEDLAGYIDYDYTTESNGTITITVSSGTDSSGTTTLVSGGTAGSIGIASDTDGAYTGLTVTGAGSTTSSSYTPSGGSLSVLNPAVTTAAIESIRDQLDALANQIVTSVNSVYSETTSDSTATFFSSTGTTAATIALSSSITDSTDIVANSSTEATGGNSVALAMADLLDTEYSTSSGDYIDGTLTEDAAGIATDIADELETATDASDTQDEVLATVTENRDNVSGVSTDEELSDLIRTQHAYQACARVLSTVNTLLEIVTTRLGSS